MSTVPQAPVDWVVTHTLVPYETACAVMQRRVDAIVSRAGPELVWLLEHPPLYTAGTSAKAPDLLDRARFPVHVTGRGGQYTYHGPGQRVCYVMLDIKRRFGDVRAYVAALEGWIIDALHEFGVTGERRPGLVGIWVPRERQGVVQHEKIAAIGVRLRRWVSSHGFSLNVAPDLAHYAGIVPCGVRDGGITSLAALGSNVGMGEVDRALCEVFERRVGRTRDAVLESQAAAPRTKKIENAKSYAEPDQL